MGMSSSQARLLTLTARMHSIEHKAQRIQAEKLRLANESDRVYDEYLLALEDKKIQYKALNSDGSITFRDATLNALENGITGEWGGETSQDILFLQDTEGKIYVTPHIAEQYNLTSGEMNKTMDDYLEQDLGLTKSTREVWGTEEYVDTNKVLGYTPILNNETMQPQKELSHTYTPVENSDSGIDYSKLKSYAEFDPSHNADTTGATEITGATTSITSGTYTISTAEGLMKFAELSANKSTAGVEIIITNDIDMKQYTNWSGIKNFEGTFDGNGHIISNLTGTQGLFDNTLNGATVKNIGLENINVNGNSTHIGGLIGHAISTNVSNCYTTGNITNTNTDSPNNAPGTGGLIGYIYIESHTGGVINNVYSSANVKGCNNVGGLLGRTHTPGTGGATLNKTLLDIKNAYAIGNVTGSYNVGGFAGYMYNDQDNANDVTDIINCYAGGNVNGSQNIGGFFGTYLFWGDYQDKNEIKDCISSGMVNGTINAGAFAGLLQVKMTTASMKTDSIHYIDNYLIKFVNCGYSDNAGPSEPYGAITDDCGNSVYTITEDLDGDGVDDTTVIDVPERVMSDTGNENLISFKTEGTIPSINSADGSGAYMSNIIGVLNKAGVYDPCDPNTTATEISDMESKIAAFLLSFNDDETDNTKLWYLNEAICAYLNGTGASGLGAALAQDIINGTTTNTASFQAGSTPANGVKRGTGGEWELNGVHKNQNGQVIIPARSDIADQLFAHYNINGYEIDKTTITNWLNTHYPDSNENRVLLANLNKSFTSGENIDDIYNCIKSNTKYTSENHYTITDWEATHAPAQGVNIKYETSTRPIKTGEEEYWDTTDPEVANGIVMWTLAKRGVIVVTEEQAASQEWLTNMITESYAIPTTFDPTKAKILGSMSEDEILNMTDAEYNEIMGIENTSVATRISLREVPDETNLKKAEAEYEAKLKRIDAKDARYDRELAVCDNERNAIKTEMETLKTVAKENVERTFKLFS